MTEITCSHISAWQNARAEGRELSEEYFTMKDLDCHNGGCPEAAHASDEVRALCERFGIPWQYEVAVEKIIGLVRGGTPLGRCVEHPWREVPCNLHGKER